MRALIVVAVVGSTVHAQPSPDPPPPLPGPYPVIQLSREEAALLARGEISDGAHLGGSLASVVVGFGLGQAIQGRWGDDGWRFTVGEGVALVGMVAGTRVGFNDDIPTLFVGSLLVFLGIRLWDIHDAFVEPPGHNTRVRMLRAKFGNAPYVTHRVLPYMDNRERGTTAGLVIRF